MGACLLGTDLAVDVAVDVEFDTVNVSGAFFHFCACEEKQRGSLAPTPFPPVVMVMSVVVSCCSCV